MQKKLQNWNVSGPWKLQRVTKMRDKGKKRQLIMEAAIQVFMEHGYEKTKIIDVAQTAGIGKEPSTSISTVRKNCSAVSWKSTVSTTKNL